MSDIILQGYGDSSGSQSSPSSDCGGKAAYPTAADVKLRVASSGLLTAPSGATALTSAATATGSAVSIAVGSSADFAVGDIVLIDSDANAELVTVTAKADATHLSAVIANNHGIGAAVTKTMLATMPYAGVDWATKALVGRREFERAVGRTMLATSQTRAFDPLAPPRRIMPTQADLVSVSSFTVNGVSQVATTDYVLGPPNADMDCEPFQWIEFLAYQMGNLPRRCVSITGLWGYAATIPEDAWNAMCARGVIEAYPELTVSRTGGLQSWKEADVAEAYGVSPFGATVDMLRLSYERAVRVYKRVTVGI